MGEIIVSVVIGGCLVVSGIVMIVVLGREEKQWKEKEDRHRPVEK